MNSQVWAVFLVLFVYEQSDVSNILSAVCRTVRCEQFRVLCAIVVGCEQRYLFIGVVVFDDSNDLAHVEAELVGVLARVAVRGAHAVQRAGRQPRQRRPCTHTHSILTPLYSHETYDTDTSFPTILWRAYFERLFVCGSFCCIAGFISLPITVLPIQNIRN